MLELGPIQKQWVAALRSGEYIQNEDGGVMCVETESGPEYCCLGVAVKLFGLEHDKFYLTGKSWELLGLRDSEGVFAHTLGTRYVSLAQMNDGGIPFAEIADYIEQSPENVFTHSV